MAQLRGINNIQQALTRHLRGFAFASKAQSIIPKPLNEDTETELFFHRRVFTMVSASFNRDVHCRLTPILAQGENDTTSHAT